MTGNLQLLSITPTCIAGAEILAGPLLQEAHLCPQLVTKLQAETLVFQAQVPEH